MYHTISTMVVLAVVTRAFSPIALSRRTSSFIQLYRYPASSASSAFVSASRPIVCCTVFNQHKKSSLQSQQQKQQLHTQTQILSSKSSSIDSANNEGDIIDEQDQIQLQKQHSKRPPITLLAGFLGSGKTTTLSNLLNNREGKKIGIIVNDVASINIDSKLLSNPNTLIGSEETVELQNGCACCSLAGELLTTVEELTKHGERDLDHIVIELSGVADPEAVKSNWQLAERVS